MDDSSRQDKGNRLVGEVGYTQPLVYLLSPETDPSKRRDELTILEAWKILWSGKWIAIGTTALMFLGSIVYVQLATEWYRSEVLLVPAEQSSGAGLSEQLGALGGLAGLAGLSIANVSNAEPIAVLTSRDFIGAFIEDRQLLTILFADQWDSEARDWITEDPENQPDIRDATGFFLQEVLNVSEEPQTNLVTLTIDWIDPEVSAEWANALVARLNSHMRMDALVQAEQNVEFLRAELAATNITTLQQSIGRLLEGEMEKLMLARGTQEFSFRVIDSAGVPKSRERPKKVLIVFLFVVLGAVLSVFLVFALHVISENSDSRKI